MVLNAANTQKLYYSKPVHVYNEKKDGVKLLLFACLDLIPCSPAYERKSLTVCYGRLTT
jgi:hypothetical protein